MGSPVSGKVGKLNLHLPDQEAPRLGSQLKALLGQDGFCEIKPKPNQRVTYCEEGKVWFCFFI